jgi:hypothetical protein
MIQASLNGGKGFHKLSDLVQHRNHFLAIGKRLLAADYGLNKNFARALAKLLSLEDSFTRARVGDAVRFTNATRDRRTYLKIDFQLERLAIFLLLEMDVVLNEKGFIIYHLGDRRPDHLLNSEKAKCDLAEEYNKNRAVVFGLKDDQHLPTEAVEPEVEPEVDAKAKSEDMDFDSDATPLSRKRQSSYEDEFGCSKREHKRSRK